MKKHLFLFASLLLTAVAVQAQKADEANAMVHYKFTHLRDTTKPTEPYKENMMLLIGKSATAYKSYDSRLADENVKKQIQEQMANGSGRIMIKRTNGGSNTEYYLFPDEKKLVRKEKLINSYLIDEPYPVIKWKISSDTMSFGALHCQKATTHFKGRDYTAWFCPDLPMQGGPWKLSGLPGLILEAYDTKRQVEFKFDGIEDLSKLAKPTTTAANEPHPGDGGMMVKVIGMDDNQDPRAIELPSNGIKTNEKEFANLKEAMRKDPNAFAQAAMAGQGGNMKLNGSGPQNSMNIKMGPPPVINNPLELPEKK